MLPDKIMKPTSAIILAGGLGTRLRKVIPSLPKPMAPIADRPFLEYLVDYWIDQGIKQFVISTGYKKECIINHFGDNYKGVTIRYSVEDFPLGTGGGLMAAINILCPSRPFLVLNGDTFFRVNLSDITKFHKKKRRIALWP